MKNFTYYQPQALTQVLPLLDKQWGTTELLAGGTDLLDRGRAVVGEIPHG